MNRSIGTFEPNTVDRAARQDRRLRLRADPERERDEGLGDEQQSERRGELRQRRRRAQRPEDPELDQQPDRQQEDRRHDQRRRGRQVRAVGLAERRGASPGRGPVLSDQ